MAARALARWLPVMTWMATIAYLSHQSEPLGRAASGSQSGLAHLAFYAVLSALLLWALDWRPAGRDLWVLPFFAFAGAVLFGVSDEVHQAYVPGRTSSESDLALDGLGAAAGVALVAALASLVQMARRTR